MSSVRPLTPENITSLAPNEVFVFGSNTKGAHGKGAALTAARNFGAKWGQGEGLQGRSYGIPTKDHRLRVLSLERIGASVRRFLAFAAEHPEKRFLVTAIGCGLAGYSAKDIAPLFVGEISEHVALPEPFWDVLAML